MTTFKDHFSRHSELYRRYRPRWSAEIFGWLASLVSRHELAWDVGTGSGQAAHGLAAHFAAVVATDASDQQIAAARPGERIRYRVARAEESGLEASSVDLVCAAQALHWFDFDGFFAECRRVVRPSGVVAAMTYMHPSVDPGVDEVLGRYIRHVFPDWPPERRHVDAGYATVDFPFDEIPIPDDLVLEHAWSRDDFLGYLATWSAAQRYRARTGGEDPRREFMPEFAAAWADPAELRPVRWPVAGRVGRL